MNEGSVMQMRRLYQFLCSVVVACVVVWVNEAKGTSALLGKLIYPLKVFLFPLLRRMYHDESFRNGYVVFYAMCFLLAVVIFALIWLLSRILPERPFLLVAIGIADVTAYPLAFLWLRSFYHISAIAALWLLLEMVACAAATVFYLYRRWRVPSLASIFLIAAHFGFWAWVNHSYDGLWGLGISYGFWSTTFLSSFARLIIFLVLDFFATLSWALYVRIGNESFAVSHAVHVSPSESTLV